MSLPTSRIKSVKTPGSSTSVEIIPERLQKNGHEAALPNLAADDVIALQSDLAAKQDSLTTSSVNDGTLDKVIGFDSSGNLVKNIQGGGDVQKATLFDILNMFPGESPLKDKPYIVFSSDTEFEVAIGNSGNQTLQYSLDGILWQTYTVGTEITSDEKFTVYFRGSNNTIFGPNNPARGWTTQGEGGEIRCDGNIEALLDYQTVLAGGHPRM